MKYRFVIDWRHSPRAEGLAGAIVPGGTDRAAPAPRLALAGEEVSVERLPAGLPVAESRI